MESNHILRVEHARKEYTGHVAVRDVNLNIPGGCIFGLLGPNGAGKTTLIRMITGITMTDSGQILLNGKKVDGVLNENIGYLPEERGLYKKMKVAEQLVYLGRLKGLTEAEAKRRTKHWLEKFDMMHWRKKKIEELSKGMQQKIQFISTILHDPDLIILDEPFTGLDPVNTNLIKEEIRTLRDRGKSIIFSTHRMEQVEEICEKIALISQGRNVLDGDVYEIKQQFKENIFGLELRQEWESKVLSQYARKQVENPNGHRAFRYEVVLSSPDMVKELLTDIMNHGFQIVSFEEVLPSLNQVFIKIVSEDEK